MPHPMRTVKPKLPKQLMNPILDYVQNMTIISFMSDEQVDTLRTHGIQITAQRLAVESSTATPAWRSIVTVISMCGADGTEAPVCST